MYEQDHKWDEQTLYTMSNLKMAILDSGEIKATDNTAHTLTFSIESSITTATTFGLSNM